MPNAPTTTSIVTSKLFKSFADTPPLWQGLCLPDDLAMDLQLLTVFQRTLADQCRCWGVIVYAASGEPIGCAALCLFTTELIDSTSAAVIRTRDAVRQLMPDFAKLRVLFCGLPVPSGASHLRVRDQAQLASVLAEVQRVMAKLAGEHHARLNVFKELKENAPAAQWLAAQGYLRGEIPPMHEIDRPFINFAHFRDSLKSRYRAQVRRSQKKCDAAGFELLQGKGAAFINSHFDARAHRLYAAVQAQAEQKLELMPASFFKEVAEALGDEVLLTVLRRAGKIHAFTFSIRRGATHYNMYSGLDYDVNNEGDLYFNLFYNDMDQAFRSGATCLHLGQTSDAFKSRLGTTTRRLFFSPTPHRRCSTMYCGFLHRWHFRRSPWSRPTTCLPHRADRPALFALHRHGKHHLLLCGSGGRMIGRVDAGADRRIFFHYRITGRAGA